MIARPYSSITDTTSGRAIMALRRASSVARGERRRRRAVAEGLQRVAAQGRVAQAADHQLGGLVVAAHAQQGAGQGVGVVAPALAQLVERLAGGGLVAQAVAGAGAQLLQPHQAERRGDRGVGGVDRLQHLGRAVEAQEEGGAGGVLGQPVLGDGPGQQGVGLVEAAQLAERGGLDGDQHRARQLDVVEGLAGLQARDVAGPQGDSLVPPGQGAQVVDALGDALEVGRLAGRLLVGAGEGGLQHLGPVEAAGGLQVRPQGRETAVLGHGQQHLRAAGAIEHGAGAGHVAVVGGQLGADQGPVVVDLVVAVLGGPVEAAQQVQRLGAGGRIVLQVLDRLAVHLGRQGGDLRGVGGHGALQGRQLALAVVAHGRVGQQHHVGRGQDRRRRVVAVEAAGRGHGAGVVERPADDDGVQHRVAAEGVQGLEAAPGDQGVDPVGQLGGARLAGLRPLRLRQVEHARDHRVGVAGEVGPAPGRGGQGGGGRQRQRRGGDGELQFHDHARPPVTRHLRPRARPRRNAAIKRRPCAARRP